MTLRTLLTVAGLGALAAPAIAQQPFIRPVPVVAPRQANPFILQAQNPIRTAYFPGYYTPSTVYVNPWGVGVIPGAYVPPTVVQQVPGQYNRLPNGLGYNPWSGGMYSPWTDSFSVGGGTYTYNPWAGTYVNPFNGGTYNPYSGTIVRPGFGW